MKRIGLVVNRLEAKLEDPGPNKGPIRIVLGQGVSLHFAPNRSSLYGRWIDASLGWGQHPLYVGMARG